MGLKKLNDTGSAQVKTFKPVKTSQKGPFLFNDCAFGALRVREPVSDYQRGLSYRWLTTP